MALKSHSRKVNSSRDFLVARQRQARLRFPLICKYSGDLLRAWASPRASGQQVARTGFAQKVRHRNKMNKKAIRHPELVEGSVPLLRGAAAELILRQAQDDSTGKRDFYFLCKAARTTPKSTTSSPARDR
jgi:hypothetical protein